MPSWPLSLPQRPLSRGYEERPPDTAIRSQIDAGPAKVRRRFTAGVRPVTAVYAVDNGQLETLDAFFTGDAAAGAAVFDWPHPRTGTLVSARFVEPPTYRPTGPDKYYVQIKMEIMP